MEQIGEVVELKGKRALVRIYRTSSCGENCSTCSGECKPSATMTLAANGLDAKVGDTVKIQMNSTSFLFLAFVGYILPVIICIATYFAVEYFTNNIIISDICAILSLIAVLVVFFIIDKLPKKSSRFSSRIIKILR